MPPLDPSRRQANRGVSCGIPASIPLFLEIRSRDNPLDVILYSKCGHSIAVASSVDVRNLN